MNTRKVVPGKVAQYYALMAWNGMESADAEKTVMDNDYSTLNKTTYAGDSVLAAKEGIEKHLLKGSATIDMDKLTAEGLLDREYFYGIGDKIVSNFGSEEELCDSIVKILEEIHDKWVATNAKKHDRDAAKNDKRLFQHLPTALIGIDELSKDLMFLAPILEDAGYNVGQMTEGPWGAFIPSKEIEAAYQRYVAKYKEENGIHNEEDLAKHIENITSTYGALQVGAEVEGHAQKRIAYMQDKNRVKLLINQVKGNNEQSFTLDQAQPQ